MSCEHNMSNVSIVEDQFGFSLDKTTGNSHPVRRFTWRNGNDITVQMISYGATITSIKIPDKQRTPDDIVMGFDDMKGYLNPLNPYFGATVGRVANRIGNSRININQVSYKLNANLGQHQLHGGFKGFDKVNWNCYVSDKKVVFSYNSPDGEEGYPGDLLVNLICELKDNAFTIKFKATTTKPTFVNLTNHSYFNLAGHNKGPNELYKHVVCINANKITDIDDDFIPNGKFISVANTIFDLQTPKVLKDVIDKVPKVDGYDHNFCINKGSEQGNTFLARVEHPESGRVLEVYSNQPGVQFYTTNNIGDSSKNPSKPMKTLKGKGGSPYIKHGAFCLETQNYPDAINHENFPKAALYPGETYIHTVIYKFLTK